MIQIKANKSTYLITQTWDELTIKDAISIAKIDMPEVLKDFYSQEKLGLGYYQYLKSISLKDRTKTIPQYIGEVLQYTSDMDKDVISRLVPDARNQIYEIIEGIVYGIHYIPNYKPKGIKSFKFKDKSYYLPNEKAGLFGDVMPAAELTAVEFTEVADLEVYADKLQGGNIDVLPVIIAILCRPRKKVKGKFEREKYNEAVILKRAELFKGLPCTVAWEVRFFMEKYTLRSRTDTLRFLKVAGLKLAKQQVKAG